MYIPHSHVLYCTHEHTPCICIVYTQVMYTETHQYRDTSRTSRKQREILLHIPNSITIIILLNHHLIQQTTKTTVIVGKEVSDHSETHKVCLFRISFPLPSNGKVSDMMFSLYLLNDEFTDFTSCTYRSI